MSSRGLDLSGQRFGMLTALYKSPEKERKYCIWECVCDCGNKVKVSTKHLQRGTITNCGCIPKGNACNGSVAENITGQKFGELTAVEKAVSKQGKTRWSCKCSCGGNYIAFTSMLKSGRTWHCGCMARGTSSSKKLDLHGKRFGRLLAIEATEKRNQKGSIIWKCKCDCGMMVEVAREFLISGNTVSCGCRKTEIKESIGDQLTFINGTCVEWLRSRKHRSDNTSGFRGVYKYQKDKWRASIGFKRKKYHLGTFDSFEKAKSARQNAEKEIHEDFVLAWEKWHAIAKDNPEWALENPLVFDVLRDNGRLRVNAPILDNKYSLI